MAKFSKTASAGARLYYFDVRQDSKGAEYLSITELNICDQKRNCIYLFPEGIDPFVSVLTEAVAQMKLPSKKEA